jgi:hypothetical protein
MTADHSHFDKLCALAASSQLDKKELAELSEHAAHCVLCHDRMAEFRRVGIQLFFVHALKNSGERLPKGMQQRFAARAIREGIPLRSSTQGVRFSALGSVTILLVALLLVVVTLNRNSARDISPVVLDKETRTAQTIPTHAVTVKRVVAAKLPLRGSRRSSAIWRSQVTPLFATNSEIIRNNAPHLLAACEPCTFSPPAAQSFHGSLDPNTFRTGLHPDFKANVAHLVWNVVPQ